MLQQDYLSKPNQHSLAPGSKSDFLNGEYAATSFERADDACENPQTRSRASSASRMSNQSYACVPVARIGMFVNNELVEIERQFVEMHCAVCGPCREDLVEIMRGLIAPWAEGRQLF